MVSPFSTAIQAALAAARTVRGETVTYVTDSESIEISGAIRGSTAWDRSAPFNGVRVGDRSTDWLIPAADLVDSNGDQIEPARTHVIQTEQGNFRVMPFGTDKQLWQWHDRERSVYRIHTKERE